MITTEKMSINWARAYRVDNKKGLIEEVGHVGSLEEYVQFYMRALRDSKRTAPHNPRPEPTEVLSLMGKLTDATIAGSPDDETETYRQKINKRFLEKEIEAQERVDQLHTVIKSGCLIHALVTIEGKHHYLIAKLNWNEYLESISMQKSSGIAFDGRVLGRSCLAELAREDGAFSVKRVEVSLDTANVRYFVTEFLEVKPVYDNSESTRKMTQSVVRLIDGSFRKNHPRAHLELKNAFLCKVRSSERIDYGPLVREVFYGYFDSPACLVENDLAKSFLKSVDTLPEKKGFARQFDLVPSAIRSGITKTSYELGHGVTLVVNDSAVTDSLESVVSGVEPDGRTFLKIFTTDQDAIKAFELYDHAGAC